MKRLWVCLLAVLLTVALAAMGAMADEDYDLTVIEADGGVSAGVDEFSVSQLDEGVPEASGLLVNSVEEEQPVAAEDWAAYSQEEPVETTSEPVERTMEDAEEFEIINGVLLKYNGPGGDVTIPEGVTRIGKEVFSLCTELNSVRIPNTVTSIGNDAFSSCYNLKAIDIPQSVKVIGDRAFMLCEGLTSVTLPKSAINFGHAVFFDCASLESITIPEGITSLGGQMFRECVRLTTVHLPSSLTTIDYYTFMDCSSLKSVTIPSSVSSIGMGAFSGCTMLESAVIPAEVKTIEERAYENCVSLKRIVIESDAIEIEDSAFDYIPSSAVFYTHCETPATKWARANNYAVVQTAHETVNDLAVTATCTEDGKTAGAHCGVCGEILQEQQVVPAKGHTVVKLPAVAATYTKTGLTAGSRCSVCGKVLEAQEKVPKLQLPEDGILLTKNKSKKIKAGATLQIVLDGVKAKAYKSDNAAVATVSKKGLVTAKLAGTAKITVTPKTGKALTLTVKVSDVNAPKKITIVQGKAATLKKGKKLTLQVKLKPAKANYALTWSTSDKKVATVSKKGVVTAKKKGTAKITVTTQNGKTATITVTVK